MSPQCSRLVVQGELGPRYAAAFDGMTIRAHDGQTDITGTIIDQSHLQGLLERIANLGLTLHSFTPIETGNLEADMQPRENSPQSPTTTPGNRSKGP